MLPPDSLWIPIVLAAAAAQTVRNAAQRSLLQAAGTLAATLVRFLYGMPFTFATLGLLATVGGAAVPSPSSAFVAWVALGAMSQLAATAFLIRAMEARSFVVAVTYSKTEIVQIGAFSVLLLSEPLTLPMLAAIGLATAGILLLSRRAGPPAGARSASRYPVAALLGLASGAGFALSAVGYRGAAVALGHPQPWMSGVYSLAWAQALQSLVLGGWLLARDPAALGRVRSAWRVSTLAGAAGTLASIGWLTAFAMRSAVDVRIVGLVEVLYSYLASRRYFAERVSTRETVGIVLVVAGIARVSTT